MILSFFRARRDNILLDYLENIEITRAQISEREKHN